MNHLYRFLFCFLAVAASVFGQTATVGLSDGDEFVGPFASWTNVKTAYGAVGDGVTDDTTALQNALTNVGVNGNSPVIYLPAGTYRITSGLKIAFARQGISIIGQDPLNTKILWAGPAGQEMLYLNGVSYAKFSRITWNGSGTALTGVDFSWDGNGPFGGSTYIENSDEVFENLSYGIRGGSLGYEDSENAILRCQFLNIATAGISVENFNALDFYVWDCTFINNYVGLTNAGGGGNFHVYGSLFQGSTRADIEIGPTSFFSFRQNFSQNSNAFLIADPVGSASAAITMQSNTILDTASSPLTINNVGTVMMFDNVIRGNSSQTSPLVTVADTADNPPVAGGLVVMGNTVSEGNWYSVPNGGEVIDINNNVVARSAVNANAPTMPGALPNYGRQIFEVPAGSTDTAIQAAIDAAVLYNGQRPVVHLPASTYSVANTIVLPVGSDVQLVGDGGSAVGASHLSWSGSTSGPVVRLAGPSRATLRDLNVVGASGTGILVQNSDQPTGRVFMEQLEVQNLTQDGLFINGLDNASVILHDFYVVSDNIGVQVTGGANANAGQAVAAKNDMIAGLTASNNLSYNINSHGRLLSQDVWYEGGAVQLVDLADSGTFTLQSTHIGAQDAAHGGVQANIPTFEVNGFNGAVSLLGAQLGVRNTVGVLGSGASTSMMAMGILGPYDNSNFFSNGTSPAGQIAMVDSRQASVTSTSIPVADQVSGINSEPAFLTSMVSQARTEQAGPFSVLPAGITDARLYRVSVNYGSVGVEVDSSGPNSSTAPNISAVSISVNSTSATITWTTDQVADSQVVYGPTTNYGSSSSLNTSDITQHSVAIQNLALGTTYHYAVKSRSLSGYISISPDQTFTTPSASASSGFISSFNAGAPRNNYTGFVGMEFTVGSTVPLVSSLGRMMLSGDSGTHTVKLVRASDGQDVPGGTTTISMAGGTPGQFVYAPLATPIYLSANTSYYLVSAEVSGGDLWYDLSSVTFTSIAQVINAVYTNVTGAYTVAAVGTEAFVPLDFTYQTTAGGSATPVVSVTSPSSGASLSGQVTFSVSASDGIGIASVQLLVDGSKLGSPIYAAPYSTNWDTTTVLNGAHILSAIATDELGNTGTATPISVTVTNSLTSDVALITGFTQGTLRNNSSSWLGMEFTVGSTPITVNSLGRVYYAANTGSHVVKLVSAATGLDIPGASATVSLPSGTAGAMTYVGLTSPVQLSANTAYYLVSQEVNGGDQWSDATPVTSAGVAIVNGPIYNYGTGYLTLNGLAGESYVPVGLQYTLAYSNAGPTVSITTPAAGATVSGSVSVSATATAAAGLSIASVQFQLDGANLGAAVSTAPYTTTLSSTGYSNGNHALTAIATDSAGTTTTSTSVAITISNSGTSSGTGVAFISAQGSSVLRNNFTGYVGMEFTVGNSPLVITSLGRIFVSGNSAAHIVKLVLASTGTDVSGGTVSIQGGTAGQYTYATLAAPVTLSANTAYYLVTQETYSGDQWYDIGPVSYATGVATINGGVYQTVYTPYTLISYPGNSYVPVNFLYVSNSQTSVAVTSPVAGATVSGSALALSAGVTSNQTISSVQFQIDGVNVGAGLTSAPYTTTVDSTAYSNGTHIVTAVATGSSGSTTSSGVSISVSNTYIAASGTAFLTGFTAGALRNNYSGLVGMQITVGAKPISVSALGRIYVAGNSSSHVVKLVQASDGTDIAGGSVMVNVASGTAGQFTYASLSSPVVLSANTSYLVVSTEVSGGDQWYQITPVTGTPSLASVDGPVYWAGASYSLVTGLANQSYVPVSFLYTVSGTGTGPGAPTVSITAPLAGSTVTGTSVGIGATASAANGLTVASVQFQVDGIALGSPLTSAPYTSTFNSTLLSNGAHNFTAVATDSSGNSSTSSAVSVTISNGGSPTSGTALLSSFTPSSLRNNFTGFVGMELTVGPTAVSVTALGRIYVSGNTGQHAVKLVNASTGVDVAGGSVSVSVSAGSVGQFTYVSFASPVTLAANTSYYLVSQETSGGDQWYDVTPVTSSSVASIVAPVYNYGYGYTAVGGLGGESYVPVNLLYTLVTSAAPSVSVTAPSAGTALSGSVSVAASASAASGLSVAGVQFAVDGNVFGSTANSPYTATLNTTTLSNGSHTLTAIATDSAGNSATSAAVAVSVNNAGGSVTSLVTGYNPGPLRNNYSGFVGMQFTVGAAPITVSSLGRMDVSGNSGSHVLKLVLASSGTDVAGASVTISMVGGTAGQFEYQALAAPVTLQANTSYYLVSNELYGGDQWYDISSLAGTSAASIDGPVYNNGYGVYTLLGGRQNSGYVPLSLQYSF